MTTVVDLGPVNWGDIWRDRALWLTQAHLNELNQLTPAQLLMHPGEWRNMFASYREVIQQAGTIAQRYVNPGQQAKHFQTELEKPLQKPGVMNKAAEDEHKAQLAAQKEWEKEGEQYLKDNPRYDSNAPLGRRLWDQSKHIPGVKVVTTTAEKVATTASNVADTAENLADTVNNISKKLKDLTEKPLPDFEGIGTAIIVGGVGIGLYALSNVVKRPGT